MIFLQHFLPNFDRFDIDRLYGYLLILCQMNWPTEKKIVSDILTRIRVQRSFKFLLFFKYVINVEILEEFMHMYSNEQEVVKLELSGITHTQRLVNLSFQIRIVFLFLFFCKQLIYVFYLFLFLIVVINVCQQEALIKKIEKISAS